MRRCPINVKSGLGGLISAAAAAAYQAVGQRMALFGFGRRQTRLAVARAADACIFGVGTFNQRRATGVCMRWPVWPPRLQTL